MKRALFLDLDGTLIFTKSGKVFPKNVDDWFINPHMVNVLQAAEKEGLMVIIVSNQGGIEKGYLSDEDFEYKIHQVLNEVATFTNYRLNANIDYFYCVTNDKEDYFRKPNPGMAYQAALSHKIDLTKSIMIGDASGLAGQFSNSDKVFANTSGIGEYYDVKEMGDLAFVNMIFKAPKDV